ncbi:MAG: PfkB family carbohydrate kinase [Pseudomonadota bacterium]|nr:PfkB family carbohydrate kinase [Pseudomonadota bacterium]
MIATEPGPEPAPDPIPEPARKGVVTVLGIFAMDAVCRAPRLPYPGETLIAEGFALHPGGKGSNQAVGAARLGAEARLITRIGRDAGADLARATWAADGVRAFVGVSDARPTGAAVVFVQTGSGENAIAVHPGAALELSAADVDAAAQAGAFAGAGAFLTQLEQPLEAARRGLERAREAGALAILNPAPAPASALPDDLLALCDWITPNQTEAATLAGLPAADSPEQAEAAARALIARGARGVAVTLGAQGALVCRAGAASVQVPALAGVAAVDTTGAGDAFAAGFAVALAEGAAPEDAARFACAAAGLSVTRHGATTALATRAEVEARLGG